MNKWSRYSVSTDFTVHGRFSSLANERWLEQLGLFCLNLTHERYPHQCSPGEPSDALVLAETHDEAWPTAYRGIIPGVELEKMITRRGPEWWKQAIRAPSRITLPLFGDRIGGYAHYGRNRARTRICDGEIYELYLRPEFQGLGFGRGYVLRAGGVQRSPADFDRKTWWATMTDGHDTKIF